jgi:photosystem II stability/assembly factor-like uncharacterized protein
MRSRMRRNLINGASKKRYRGLSLLLLVLAACSQPLVEAPTPFVPSNTPIPPTDEIPTTAVASEPPATKDPETSEPVELPALPVLEPQLEPGQPVVIRQISMIDDREGWAIGEHPSPESALPIHVLRTADGGRSWNEVTPPENQELMFDIGGTFFDRDIAWIRYSGTNHVWRTENGGATWRAAEAGYPMGTATWFTFGDAQHGWMMQEVESGFGSQLVTLFKTEDGGESWHEIVSPYEDEALQSCFKTGITFSGSETGWVTYDCQGNYAEAFLDVSVSGGESWEERQLPLPPGAAEITDQGWCYSSSPRLTSDRSGMLVVTCLTAGGSAVDEASYLFLTEDLGDSWTIVEYPGGELHDLPDGTMLALARDQYVSADSGVSWTKVKTVNWDGQFSFVDPNHGWAVATDEDEMALVVTSNGGQTWQIIDPVAASE